MLNRRISNVIVGNPRVILIENLRTQTHMVCDDDQMLAHPTLGKYLYIPTNLIPGLI